VHTDLTDLDISKNRDNLKNRKLEHRNTILGDRSSLMRHLKSKNFTTDKHIKAQQSNNEVNDKRCVEEYEWMKVTQKWALMDIFEKVLVTPYGNTAYVINPAMATDECQWLGVTCTDGLVTRLELKNQYLQSQRGLPESLNLLASLEWIDVSENMQLSGSLPQLNQLKNLVLLDISNSGLTGKASDRDVCPSINKSIRMISYSAPLAPDIPGFDCDCDNQSLFVCLSRTQDVKEIELIYRRGVSAQGPYI